MLANYEKNLINRIKEGKELNKLKIMFADYTRKNFNKEYSVNITKGMDIKELTDYMKSKEISCLYASYNYEDVLIEYANMLGEQEHTCDLVCIDGIYLALI